MEKIYVSPSIEVIEVEVEEGFAASLDPGITGTNNNFNTAGFDDKGRTMF